MKFNACFGGKSKYLSFTEDSISKFNFFHARYDSTEHISHKGGKFSQIANSRGYTKFRVEYTH